MKSYTYLLAAASFAASANAADLTWDITPGTVGAGDSAITGGAGTWDNTLGNWTTNAGANNILWDNTANAADTAVFSGTGGTVNVGTPINLGGLRFTSAGYTISGSTLTFGSTQGSINTSALGTGSNQTTIASNLIGTGGLTINANGNLSASGSNSTGRLNITGDNTGLTGGIAITGGLVSFGSASAAGSAATTAGSGNTLTLSNGGGLVASTNLTLGNNVSLNATGGTFRVFGTQTLTLNGVISGSGGFNKTDAGTLALSNNNSTFTGGVNVQAGTLRLGTATNSYAFNFTGNALSVANGATLNMGGSSGGSGIIHTYNFNNLVAPISVNGGTVSFSSTNQTRKAFGAALNFSGNSTVAYSSTGATHNLDFNRTITGDGTLNFTWTGGASARNINIASGQSHNYTGNVVLGASSGLVTMVLNGTLGNAAWNINDTNWRVNLSSATHTMTSLNSSQAAVEIRGNGVASVLNVGSGNGNDTYAGILTQTTGNSLAVVKSGSGTMTLTGTNAYTGGTTVSNGKLLFNGNSSAATGTAIVDSGATIGGSGSYGGALNVTGTLAPGASIESFATGAVTLNNGSTFEYEFNSGALNGDLLVVNGTLDLSGSVGLNLLDLGSGLLNIGDKLTLINYSGAWNGGLFNGIADDSVVTVGGNNWLINYNDTTGGTNFTGDLTGSNFVTMTVVDAIPEPSVALLGGLGALALLRRRRN